MSAYCYCGAPRVDVIFEGFPACSSCALRFIEDEPARELARIEVANDAEFLLQALALGEEPITGRVFA